ncbi:hypothetical protein MKW98_006417 [Papaver atlanticum]|uniref:Peptidase metallopeptidase domain-containing protein n=1 Tax=Papaver atlanticum TaxID=357466 RepID=A0AAD4X326_9MAGN|nr:hypothetical protein MKW98_006417 [Papaver atlanticum]
MPFRCGVKDHKFHITQHFSYYIGRHSWNNSTLKLNYAISRNHTISYIKFSDVRLALRSAFAVWSSAIPVKFKETRDYEHANITIGFFYGDHGDGSPFEDNVIAHAIIGPGKGMIRFNLALTFAVDFSSEESDMAFDLETVAVHEIGHVLGLGHSSYPEAVMWPYSSPRTTNVELTSDDAYGAQILYDSNPDFDIDSLKPLNSASKSFGLKEIITISVSLVVAAVSNGFRYYEFLC